MDDGIRLFILTVAGMIGTGCFFAAWIASQGDRSGAAIRWILYGATLLFPSAVTIVAIAQVLSGR